MTEYEKAHLKLIAVQNGLLIIQTKLMLENSGQGYTDYTKVYKERIDEATELTAAALEGV